MIPFFPQPTAAAIALFVTSFLSAGDPAFAASPAQSGASPSTKAAPSASPTSATPTIGEIVDSLGPADLQAAIELLKTSYTNPNAVSETELNRAMLEGLLIRQRSGLQLLPGQPKSPAPEPPLYSEIFEGHLGYLRLGALNKTNLKALDKKLAEFAWSKVDGLIIDLRDSLGIAGDFDAAADFAKRFCPKGKPLFTLRKTTSHQDHKFSSDRDPAFHGLMVVLTDRETAGGAEPLAAVLRLYDKALIAGEATAGRAVEYSDTPLPSGKILRMAAAEAVLPDGQTLFPDGVKPDVPVEMSVADKRQIFQMSIEKGMSLFVYETERPHLNEAALLAGTNPELETTDTRRSERPGRRPIHDLVLQRAIDLVTSLEVYEKR